MSRTLDIMSFQVIVIGGSAAGLQATLTLSRALVEVLCIDSNKPCNRYAKEAHNFFANDGNKTSSLKKSAWNQISEYPNAELINGEVEKVKNNDKLFEVILSNGKIYSTKKLIFASGVKDEIELSGIKNIEKFWGNSIIPCPYCHGTEFANKKTGLYSNDSEMLQKMVPVILNWSKDLYVFTSDRILESVDSSFLTKLEQHKVQVIDSEIKEACGSSYDKLSKVILSNGDSIDLDVLYSHPPMKLNNSEILKDLGLELENGLIKVDNQQRTNIAGVWACGDCSNPMRTLSGAVYQGMFAAAVISHEIFAAEF